MSLFQVLVNRLSCRPGILLPSDLKMSKGTVILIRPPSTMAKGTLVNVPVPPIGLAYLGASLREAGFDVCVIDAVGEGIDHQASAHREDLIYHGLSPEETVARIPSQAWIIGFQLSFTQSYVFSKTLIKLVRSRFPDAFLVAGGEHFSALPAYVLGDCPELDAGCLRESEESLVELCQARAKGADLADISGIVYRAGSETVVTSARPRIRDLDSIAFPAWDLLPLENYFKNEFGMGPNLGRRLPVIMTRGCPYRCTFCSAASMWGTTYLTRDPALVLEEIRELVRRYRLDAFEVIDLTMAINRNWLLEFLRLLKESGLPVRWSITAGTRSEILDRTTLQLMRETGLAFVVLAPESGSQEILDKVQKRVSLQRVLQVIREAAGLGVMVKVNLILGFPFERRRDVFKSFFFGLKCALHGAADCGFNFYKAHPGSQLFDEMLAKGKIRLNDDLFDANNFDWDVLRARSFSEGIPTLELKIYRLVFLLCIYAVFYLSRPARIFQLARALIWGGRTNTLSEERLRESGFRFFRSQKPVSGGDGSRG